MSHLCCASAEQPAPNWGTGTLVAGLCLWFIYSRFFQYLLRTLLVGSGLERKQDGCRLLQEGWSGRNTPPGLGQGLSPWHARLSRAPPSITGDDGLSTCHLHPRAPGPQKPLSPWIATPQSPVVCPPESACGPKAGAGLPAEKDPAERRLCTLQ